MDFNERLTEKDVELVSHIFGNEEYAKELVGMPLEIVDALTLILLWMTMERDAKGDLYAYTFVNEVDRETLNRLTMILLTIITSEAKASYAGEGKKTKVLDVFMEIFHNTCRGFKEAEDNMKMGKDN